MSFSSCEFCIRGKMISKTTCVWWPDYSCRCSALYCAVTHLFVYEWRTMVPLVCFFFFYIFCNAMKCDVHVHVVNNLCKSFGILFGCPNSECSIKTLHWFKINIPTIRYLIIQVPTIFCFVKYAFDCLCFLKFSLCLRFDSYRIKVFTESVLFVVLPNFLLYIFIVGMFPRKKYHKCAYM